MMTISWNLRVFKKNYKSAQLLVVICKSAQLVLLLMALAALLRVPPKLFLKPRFFFEP